MPPTFEWDPAKAVANLKEHRVSFPEATAVFADPFGLQMPDTEHSEHEDRWVAIGKSHRERLIVVVFTERGNAIRIISARKTNNNEKMKYDAKRR